MATKTSKHISAESESFPIFLTDYDPSDLPGGSLDPLGFERGYLLLADKLLPGLTNVADKPRYFSVLCAGAFLAPIDANSPPRVQYQNRLDCILRIERFWALANVLATQSTENIDELSDSGIRGVTYSRNAAESLLRVGSARTDADFKLLSRQVPYGVVGIYGSVADGMRLLDRRTFILTPDLGEKLAEGFIDQSEMPQILRKAIANGGEVPVDKLADWGQRSHVSGDLLPIEGECFRDALIRNPIRARMSAALAQYPFQEDGDTELKRLARLLPTLTSRPENRDLAETVTTILAYEECFRLLTLGFERLLWLCKNLPAASATFEDLAGDEVLPIVREGLPAAASRFTNAMDSGQSDLFKENINRLEPARRFIELATSSCGSNKQLALAIMAHHDDVQRGKFDRGRRKMPWLEITGNRICMTMTKVGGLNKEATSPDDIVPHPYRLASADALIASSEIE
jgi:hypothetical protein